MRGQMPTAKAYAKKEGKKSGLGGGLKRLFTREDKMSGKSKRARKQKAAATTAVKAKAALIDAKVNGIAKPTARDEQFPANFEDSDKGTAGKGAYLAMSEAEFDAIDKLHRGSVMFPSPARALHTGAGVVCAAIESVPSVVSTVISVMLPFSIFGAG